MQASGSAGCGKGEPAAPSPFLLAGVGFVDLLKVDVEGAENKIFSNYDWMQRVGTFVVELHDRTQPGCREAVESVTQGFHQLYRGELTFFRATQDSVTAGWDALSIRLMHFRY